MQWKPVFHRVTSYSPHPWHPNAPFDVLNCFQSHQTPPIALSSPVTDLHLHWEALHARASPAPSMSWVARGTLLLFGQLAGHRCWNHSAVHQGDWLIPVCLLQAVLDSNLVFQLVKLSNGFKKLSGDRENERKTEKKINRQAWLHKGTIILTKLGFKTMRKNSLASHWNEVSQQN